MKRNAILLMVFLLPLSFWAQKTDGINWITFEELDLALAKKPKKTLIFFYADWCVYCKKIERSVFTKLEVITTINKDYYAVRMDVESKDKIYFDGIVFKNAQAQGQRHGIHELPLLLASREGKTFSLPATLILDREFKIRERFFEYYTSKQLLKMLQ